AASTWNLQANRGYDLNPPVSHLFLADGSLFLSMRNEVHDNRKQKVRDGAQLAEKFQSVHEITSLQKQFCRGISRITSSPEGKRQPSVTATPRMRAGGFHCFSIPQISTGRKLFCTLSLLKECDLNRMCS
ncbi:MAG: hypothetical protein IJC43_06150, partial [Clostridia bacterium]|nr:hypothetical protein [Clostridia bacterium]